MRFRKVTLWVMAGVFSFAALCAAPAQAANERDVDFDWILKSIDKLLKQFAPTLTQTFSDVDGDGNGLKEDVMLAALGAILRNNTTNNPRVTSINATDAAAIRADFAAARLTLNNDLQDDDAGSEILFVGGSCTLLKDQFTYNGGPLPDCRLTTVLKSDDLLGQTVGTLVGNMLLDWFAALVTIGDNAATFNYINTTIDNIIDAAVANTDIGGLWGLARTAVLSDLRVGTSGFTNNSYGHWGASPGGPAGPTRRNAFGSAGNLDLDANTNSVEWTAAANDREAFLRSNTIGVYAAPTNQNNDQPMRITLQPVSGIFPALTNIVIPVTYTGASNGAPITYQWEDARNFGDKDFPTDYGITVLTDGPNWSGTTSSTLTLLSPRAATHDKMRPWLRISDSVTVYNNLPVGNGNTAGSIEADGLGGRTSVFGNIKIAEAQGPGGTLGPIVQCSGALTLSAVISEGEDGPDADTTADATTYQWRKAATVAALSNAASNIGGATLINYTDASVTAGDAGFYACLVTQTFNGTVGANGLTNPVQLIFPSSPSAPSTPNLADASDSGTSNTDNLTNDNTPTFTGTAEVGATVAILRNGVSQATGVATDGTYSITLATQAEGAANYTATATNCAGTSAASAALPVTFDTICNPPTLLDLVAGFDSGINNADNITNVQALQITGQAETGATVSLTSSLAGPAGNSAAGPAWTVNTAALGAGTHNFTATAVDVAGNTSGASGPLAVAIDLTAPSAALSSGAPNPTNASPIAVGLSFGEAVFGFSLGADVLVGNGSAVVVSDTATSNGNVSFNVTPSSNGIVTVNVAANVVQDTAGNQNTAATQLSRTFDNVAPAAVLSSGAPAVTNTSPIPVTLNFGETVSGFSVASDVLVSNGTAVLASDNGNGNYSLNITPAGQGVVTVNVNAAVVSDTAGNANTAAAQLSRTFDSVAPAPVLSTGVANPTNQTPFSVTLTYGEAVTGFDISTDVTVTNGSASLVSDNGGGSYTLNVTPAGQGIVTVDVPAGGVTDSAGSANTPALSLSRTFDSVAPAAVIGSSVGVSGSITATAPVPFTVSFGETVNNFTSTDLVVTGGSVAGFVDNGSGNYSFNVNPSGNGTIAVNIAANAANDLATNQSTAATEFTIEFDSPLPVVTIISPIGVSGSFTNVSPVDFTITFNPAVTDFDDVGDVVVTNGTVGAITPVSGTVYTVQVTPGAEGVVTVDVPAGVAFNAGNPNQQADFDFTYDITAPGAPSVVTATTGPTNVDTVSFTVTFSEIVNGFNASDMSLSFGAGAGSGTIGEPVSLGSGDSYQVDVTGITGNGDMTLTVNTAAGITDRAGNALSASGTSAGLTIDNLVPSVSSNLPALSGPTNADSITFTITFNESVSGFTSGDLAIIGIGVNGVVSEPVDLGAGDVYTVDVTNIIGDGALLLMVGTAAVTDAAGNVMGAQNAGNPVIIDNTAPSFVLNAPGPVVVNCGDGYTDPGATASDIPDGDVTGDIVVTGEITQFTPPGDHTITYSVTDTAGNVGQATRSVTVTDNCPLAVTTNGAVVVKDSGDSHTFQVFATGAIGALSYQWQQQVDDGSKALVWENISGADSDTFTLPIVGMGDAGNYRAEVSDAVTTVVSEIITLQVVGELPVAGFAGVAGAAAALAAIGFMRTRRRK